jgi:hypothetical protein
MKWWEIWFFWVSLLSFCSQKYSLLWSTCRLTLICAVSLHCSMSGTLSQLQDDHFVLRSRACCEVHATWPWYVLCHYTVAWVVLCYNCKMTIFFTEKISPCSKVNTVYGLCWDLTDTYMCIHTNSLGLGQNPKHDMWWNVHTVCQVHSSYHTALWYSMNDTYNVFFNSSMKQKSRFS